MTTPPPVRALAIHIGNRHAGDLVLQPNDLTEFKLADSYMESSSRPILGQIFEDDLTQVHRARMRLPPFFSNLLPEGRLRALVANQIDMAPEREFFLLARLGEDLPGAVRALPASDLSDVPAIPAADNEGREHAEKLKFSLAGVQLKLSMLREGRGMTLPASGQGGDWIVKLPGTVYVGVPENEYAMMNWARLVGIEVPETALIPVTDLRGLPEKIAAEDGFAFAVRRFDRPTPESRIHIEDFAQVRDLYPDYRQKYLSTNYETIGKTILKIAGPESFDEFVRRLAFAVLSANADAHIKNWSFIYRDPQRAALSPAYDLVATIEFIENDALALNLAKTRAWDQISIDRFVAFAERIGADPVAVVATVRDTVQRATDLWSKVKTDFPVSPLLAERLERHWKRLPLV